MTWCMRIAVAALGLVWLVACSEGYPTADTPQIDPARMTQDQLLGALNAMGKEPHLGKRWRYALDARCELEVVVGKGEADRRRVVLEGAAVSSRSVDGVSEIRLVPKVGGEPEAVTVLATRRWSDSVRARTLLNHLEVSCGNPAAASA
jgi:hypothetical protein